MGYTINEDGRFHWGLNIDDAWTYAGHVAPKSILVPHLLSIKSRAGSFSIPQSSQVKTAQSRHGENSMRSLIHRRSSEAQGTAYMNSALASFLKSHNVNFVRMWFPWNFFEKYLIYREPGPGQKDAQSDRYHFPLDDFVSKMGEAEIAVIGVLGNGYSRFLPSSVQTNELQDYLKRLVESSTQIVRHYKDKIKVWQIENEPNWWKAHRATHWRNGRIWLDAKNQEPILSALYNLVRSESPDGKIVINLEADNISKMDWPLYAKYCDIIGLDFYPNYSHSSPSDASVISKTASQVKRFTGHPIFVIETGYPTGPKWLGYNQQKQAKYVRSACEQAFTCDAITGLGWFRFSDSYWNSFPSHENYFGLLSREGRPKQAWVEYAMQISKNTGRNSTKFDNRAAEPTPPNGPND